MSVAKRLTQVFESAKEIEIGDASKLILFSDVHRGDDSPADEFAPNQVLLLHALNHYFERGFAYIEIGDGDELVENQDLTDIKRAHASVFREIRRFHEAGRFLPIYGNHDILWMRPENVRKHLTTLYNEATESDEPLFEGIRPQEGLVLNHRGNGMKILVVHGHQGDFINETLWWMSGLVIRRLWRPLQLVGVTDPTRPSKDKRRIGLIERRIIRWIQDHKTPVICGHTHRAMFPRRDDVPYFNTGCCVFPRRITGMEILNGQIQLIQWMIRPNADGVLCVVRDVVAGPRGLASLRMTA